MTQQYKVTIQGPGLSVEMTDVPKTICDQITLLILTGESAAPLRQDASSRPGIEDVPVGRGAPPVVQAARRDHPELSLREFLDSLEPKRGPDKITAIGVYLKDHHGQETFSGAELERAFQSASEPVPANMPRDIKWTVKTGWIAPALAAKGRYYVTKTGRSVAERKFPKDAVKKSRLGRKPAKKSPSSNADS